MNTIEKAQLGLSPDADEQELTLALNLSEGLPPADAPKAIWDGLIGYLCGRNRKITSLAEAQKQLAARHPELARQVGYQAA